MEVHYLFPHVISNLSTRNADKILQLSKDCAIQFAFVGDGLVAIVGGDQVKETFLESDLSKIFTYKQKFSYNSFKTIKEDYELEELYQLLYYVQGINARVIIEDKIKHLLYCAPLLDSAEDQIKNIIDCTSLIKSFDATSLRGKAIVKRIRVDNEQYVTEYYIDHFIPHFSSSEYLISHLAKCWGNL